MQTMSRTTNSRMPLWAAVGIGAALLALMIHLNPVAQISHAHWQVEHPAF
ncbi:hypothetical protein RPE78_09515 [Thioclava litoralis]|uniref:Uncharacterized protein n=1 Tax=Thioclava litoralis TaxID=3076557 RepID=A0ABZ1DYI8_9RHOB|nr:hypothetical protein RPE78_09515 [Thioclava sp. FTW29]